MNDPPRSLFDMPDPYQLARRGDPHTSFEAAGSLVAVRITRTRLAILELLHSRPDGLSDEQIALLYTGPKASPSGLRTRRAELVEGGLVIDTGKRTRTKSGRHTIIWALSPLREVVIERNGEA